MPEARGLGCRVTRESERKVPSRGMVQEKWAGLWSSGTGGSGRALCWEVGCLDSSSGPPCPLGGSLLVCKKIKFVLSESWVQNFS